MKEVKETKKDEKKEKVSTNHGLDRKANERERIKEEGPENYTLLTRHEEKFEEPKNFNKAWNNKNEMAKNL